MPPDSKVPTKGLHLDFRRTLELGSQLPPRHNLSERQGSCPGRRAGCVFVLVFLFGFGYLVFLVRLLGFFEGKHYFLTKTLSFP